VDKKPKTCEEYARASIHVFIRHIKEADCSKCRALFGGLVRERDWAMEMWRRRN
jgi:hypothetical protein